MEQATAAPLKKTPLNARHRAHGAKMVPFGGWDMPVEYTGIVAEHLAVRERAGLFDVSHMGQIEIAGKDALAGVARFSSNDAAKLAVGQAHYSGLMSEKGTFVDDLLVYRLAPAHFLMVVNASHIPDDYAYIAQRIQPAGDVVAVYLEGDDPVEANRRFAASSAPFDRWFKDRCKEIFPAFIDFDQPVPRNEEIFSSV